MRMWCGQSRDGCARDMSLETGVCGVIAAAARATFTALIAASVVLGRPESLTCNVSARTDAGWVCGLARWAENGAVYASFRGVPYAKQPVGGLRFKELQPPQPWDDMYDAREEGPVCEQSDVVYGSLVQPHGMSEACIHANIHVPIAALPIYGQRLARQLQSPHQAGFDDEDPQPQPQPVKKKFLPIVVFIHGGGFMCGSGDTDLHGPEYLVSKQVIVITFNYRLNVYGFLNLNTKEVPGNQGLRDMVTLLRWVRRNAKRFGGDPNNVTLMGQSAGAIAAHLLTLSKATEGLYKRAILMSGNAISTFATTSPAYGQYLSTLFLSMININATDLDEIHRRLLEVPASKLNEVNKILLDRLGLMTFIPTVESEFPGVTRVLDEDPEVLVAKGRGNDVPIVMGFTDVECEVFRRRLEEIDIVSKITDNPVTNVPPQFIYTTQPKSLPDLVKKIDEKYYNGTVDIDKFINYCTDSYYKYPALKYAEKRAAQGGAPLYIYEFTYDGDHSVLRKAFNLKYKGAAHIEDLSYVFRVNSMLGTHKSFPPKERDDSMKDWMTNFVTNFMQHSEPVTSVSPEKEIWPPVTSEQLVYQVIDTPDEFKNRGMTEKQQDIVKFFDSLRS